MMIKRFENDNLVTYEYNSLEELHSLIEKWKEQFRKLNRVEEGKKDKAYERYCMELDELLISKEVHT